jgi:hypothetical protein
LDGIDIYEGNISNVEIVSRSSRSWAGMDKGAMQSETKGIGEMGRMEAKLYELELRKSE